MTLPPSVVSGVERLVPDGYPQTLPQLLAAVADRFGDRTALVTTHGRWTFAQLHADALQAAARLVRHGVRRGDRVGVLAPNGRPWIAAVFGVSAAGAVPVMLHAQLTVEEIRAASRTTQCSALLMSRLAGSRPVLAEFLAQAGNNGWTQPDTARADDEIEVLLDLGDNGEVRAVSGWAELGAGQVDLPSVVPDDDGLILMTSGTSGTAKAILHTQRSPCLQAQPWVEVEQRTAEDIYFSAYPWCWSSGFVRALCSTLLTGGTLVTVDHLRVDETLDLIERERCTRIILPAAHLAQRLIDSPGFAERDLSSVRVGSPVICDALGAQPLGFVGYGLSETFTLVTATRHGDTPAKGAGWVGAAAPGWTIRIADFDTGAPVPHGEVGRIELRGSSMMREYLGRDRADYMTADGFLMTSDSGYLDDDGEVVFSGRTDDIIRSAGANVSTTEVEEVLLQHPQITNAVAFGLPHPTLGQALVACVITSVPSVTDADLLRWLRERLAGYKVPRTLLIVDEADMRFTASQKIQRGHARDLATARISANQLWVS